MATLQYSGYRGGTTSLNNSPSLSLSKSAGDISNYRIDSIIANIYLSTNAYSKTYAVQVDITGASGTAYVKLNADNYTGGWVQVWLTASAGFNPNSIQAMVVSCSTDGDKIFLKSNTMTVDVNYSTYGACGAPTYVSAPAYGVPGGSINVSWSGATAGSNVSISGYGVFRSTSQNGSYSYIGRVDTSYSYGSYTDTNLPANVTLYYKIITYASISTYSSGFSNPTAGTSVYYGRCSPPTSLIYPQTVAPANGITISWEGASAGQNVAIAGFTVFRAMDDAEGTYTQVGTVTGMTTSGSYKDEAITSGHTYYYKIRTDGAVSGYSSDLSNATGGTYVNTVPSAPSLPGSGGKVYNARPRVLVTLGADADGENLTVSAAGFTASRSNAAPGDKVLLRKTTEMAAGAITCTVTNTDPHGSGASADKAVTVATAVFTDDPVQAGTTIIKAAHINELRTMLDDICAYYGLAATSWAQTVEAGVTPAIFWPGHMKELQETVARIAAHVNGWDTQSAAGQIVLPDFLSINQANAAAINQMREIIKLL